MFSFQNLSMLHADIVCPACELHINELGKTVIANKRKLCSFHRARFANLLRDPFVPQGLVWYWCKFLG